ncbi:MAG: LapA dom protein [Patescibacteria group bacterium]|mgnify:FL=1|jgi:uncharacterized integral membrane protein|nr:LapA dom protein [Patescibacteria group bacterium]
MLFFLILGLLLGSVTVIFALQNTEIITVSFFNYEFSGSLALILLLAALSGVVVCLFLSVPEMIKSHLNFRALKKQNKNLEEELNLLKTSVSRLPKDGEVKL